MMNRTGIIRLLVDFFRRESIRQVIILTDENVEKHYSDYFSELTGWVSVDKVVLPAGEQAKSMETTVSVWSRFVDRQYDKGVLLLNFGGGVICDIGGFVASTYKRGIRFVNFPTTLLAMIDASVGGKNGVNVHHVKNAVGTFYFPDIQLPVDLKLLETLPKEELKSGFGELVKYALIGSEKLFNDLDALPDLNSLKEEHIGFCIDFKRKIVQKDPNDAGLRHILNYGHTIGHAIESYSSEAGTPMSHGLAVAQGLYYESLLSAKLGRLPKEEWEHIDRFLKKQFDIMPITDKFLEKLTPYMLNDKKNRNNLVNFTLIDHIGHADPDFQIALDTLARAICPLQ